jgi:hypothetical protein
MNKDLPRDEDGKLKAYAFPGGYEYRYFTGYNDMFCAACARVEEDSWEPGMDVIETADIYWEGPAVECASHASEDCPHMLESEYGDQEEDNEV